MQAFLVTFSAVALAEMGDRTQLLALVLAARYRKPWPIIAGIVVATLFNHLAAGALGIVVAGWLNPRLLYSIVAVGLMAMAGWTLVPDDPCEPPQMTDRSAFLSTLALFFVVEIGDKTQIATATLAAAYKDLIGVVAGSTLGMLAADVPVVFVGNAFAARLPLKAIRFAAAVLFGVLAAFFAARAITG
ncbi:MAG TPA: TMEM165/GDT1 family protein [Rhizomicrobium sp.]|nr:TMEM165/GDT1 family protein [Rhizomicrobium sp.]